MYVVNECWKSHAIGLSFKKMSYTKRPLNRVLSHAKESGIINKILSKYTIAPPSLKKRTALEVLRIENYEVAIYLLMVCFGLDILVFLLELMSKAKFKSAT